MSRLRKRSVIAAWALVMGTGLWSAAAGGEEGGAEPTVLITVNGESITAADIDRKIMEAHRGADMDRAGDQLLRNLVEKAINDRLILQEARSMGLQDEPAIRMPLEEQREQHGISLYLQDEFRPPMEVEDDELQRFFERNYWRVELRQIVVPERQLATELVSRIRAGASMAELARQLSLGSHRLRDGAHNPKHWMDVEDILRPVIRELEVGELSEPFAYHESWSLLRLEARHDADPNELTEKRDTVVSQLLRVKRNEAWEAFVAEHLDAIPIETREDVLSAIRADSGDVYRGEFLRDGDRIALSADGGNETLTESRLRRTISHTAMQMGTSTFEEILDAALEESRERLALLVAAKRGGYLDRPEVDERFHRDLEQRMLETYLEETVANRIKFNRDEFEEFYEEHAEEFRGEEEVRLSFILSDDEAVMEDAAARLAEGADFGYVRREVQGGDGHGGTETANWSQIGVFSDVIRDALDGMPVGGTSGVLPFSDNFMIVRLDGRRPGQVKPMEDVEMSIRQVMYQRKFSALLDEQLRLLKERSDIVRYEDRIEQYFGTDS